MKKLFTSESVTDGHPDKVCDSISDGILDAILSKDSQARVACECIATTGLIHVMGEISTNCYVDIPDIARKTVRDIGYTKHEYGFDNATLAVLTAINCQSPDIALGVDMSLEAKEGKITDNLNLGAGDQGLMFGYACNETSDFMPMPISKAHALAKRLSDVRKQGILPYLRPDGKTQVTIEYDGFTPKRIDTVVVSAQHDEHIALSDLKQDIFQHVIKTEILEGLIDDDTRIFINPTGRFVTGGPAGDSGLTGRKIIVDTYGGYARHGGGAFSGKDPTKVDRSAAYAARYAAKNIVAAGLASHCEIQFAYAIGVAQPVSVFVDTFGTGVISDDIIAERVMKAFDLRPAAIIEKFNLRRPIYNQLSAFGHFGRSDLDLPWEKTDMLDALV